MSTAEISSAIGWRFGISGASRRIGFSCFCLGVAALVAIIPLFSVFVYVIQQGYARSESEFLHAASGSRG